MVSTARARSSARPAAASSSRRGAPSVARGAAVLLAGTALVLGAPGTAGAHTTLAGSTPATGAAVDAPPAQVTLVFTEAVSADLADLVVTAPDGTDTARGEAQVDGATVTQPLTGAGPAGAYRVAYRVVAADGHPVTGTLEFTVAAGTAGDQADAAAPEAGDNGAAVTEGSPGSPDAVPAGDTGGGSGWLLPVAAVALAVAGLGLLAARVRAGRRTR